MTRCPECGATDLLDALTIERLPRPRVGEEPDDLLTVAEASRATGIHVQTLLSAIHTQRLPIYDKLGSGKRALYRLRRDDVDTYAARHRPKIRRQRGIA